MLTTLSSNAILAKARAMYGKRLVYKDYRALLDASSVNEVAAYLKQTTRYSEILTGVDEREVHRGQLELLLHQKLFYDFAALCRYEISVGEHFADYLLARSEIEQIMHSLMLLAAGKSNEYLFSMPTYLDQHSHINLTALSKMNNYGDFLQALAHTPYQKLLEPFAPTSGEQPDLTVIENVLYTYLYNGIYENIQKHTRGKTRQELKELFDAYIDLNNYVRIIRMKKYYNSSPDEIRSLLLPFGTLKPHIVNQMLAAETPMQVTSVMNTTSRGKRLVNVEYSFVDELPVRAKFKQCQHFIRFSTHPPVVMLSYIFLTEIEVQNIIHVIEGVRYQLPEEETKKLLVYAKVKTA